MTHVDENASNEDSAEQSPSTDWLLEFSHNRLDIARDDLRSVIEQAAADGMSIHEAGLKQGVLDMVQADVLQTLTQPSTTLPDYEFQDVLGRGAMGVVYRARQKSLDRTVAIKTILLSMAGRGSNQRFQQEARTIAQLRHPNILSAYDLHSHGGRLFLVLEFLEGETVEELLRDRKQLDEFSTWHLIRQAAAGLSEANNLGIVHRDIKPANLFCVPPPAGYPLPKDVPLLKITDFGLALLTESEEDATRMTQQGSTLGTPAFMAPEQVDKSDVDLRADIYALGVTAFALISGELPFKGKFMAMISKKISGEAPLLSKHKSDATEGSVTLIAEMIRRDPAERIDDYGTLLERIDQVLAALSSGVASPSAQPQSSNADKSPAPEHSSASIHATDIDEESTAIFSTDAINDDALNETTKSFVALQSPDKTGNRKFLWGALAAIAFATAAFFWFPNGTKPLPPTEMELTGRSVYLFDGESASNWTTQRGAVNPTTDTEDGRALGIRLAAQRSFAHYDFYTLAFGLDLHTASSFDLHFGFEKQAGHWIFRVSDDSLSVHQVLKDGTIRPHVESKLRRSPWKREFDDEPIYREVSIETEPNRMVVKFDGSQVVVIPTPQAGLVSNLAVVAQDGQVLLSSISVAETRPKP